MSAFRSASRTAAAAVVLVVAAGCGQVGPPGGGAGTPSTGNTPTSAPATGTPPSASTTPPGSSTGKPPGTVTPPATPAPQPRTGTWRKLAPAPIGFANAAVWTGSRMLVVGERLDQEPVTRYDVASYDPVRDRWQVLASPPQVPGRYEGTVKAVWTGTEMLTFGGVLGAAYNPTTNTWRKLPSPGGTGYGPGGHAMIWTGRQLIVWGGGCCGGAGSNGAAYTPATNTWRQLPPAPLNGMSPNAAWTGTEMVIAGGDGEHGPLAFAAAYNPTTNTWRQLPKVPVPVRSTGAVWDGSEVLLTSDGYAYSPRANRWRRLPAPTHRYGAVQVWTGSRLLVWGGTILTADEPTTPPHGVAYDPATNRWTALPVSPLAGRTSAVCVWTGRSMIVWGGWPTRTNGNAHDGAAYTP